MLVNHEYDCCAYDYAPYGVTVRHPSTVEEMTVDPAVLGRQCFGGIIMYSPKVSKVR